jgi:hypothetical protein
MIDWKRFDSASMPPTGSLLSFIVRFRPWNAHPIDHAQLVRENRVIRQAADGAATWNHRTRGFTSNTTPHENPSKSKLPPGQTTVFRVTFKPSGRGNRGGAVIRIAGNDADESPFDINVSALGK